VARSEFRLHWLDYFSKAFISMHKCGSGQYVYVGEVENPDILVVIADFFMRVHEIRWTAVCGVYQDTIVVIFRGDGVTRDLGRYASAQFSDIGSAGTRPWRVPRFPSRRLRGATSSCSSSRSCWHRASRRVLARRRSRESSAVPVIPVDTVMDVLEAANGRLRRVCAM